MPYRTSRRRDATHACRTPRACRGQPLTQHNYNWRSQTYTNIGMESQTHVGGYGTLGGRSVRSSTPRSDV
jgi:hypothetical protein